VLEIFNNFVKKYPDFISIKSAGSDRIQKELFSLGLEWRARMLYDMSEVIVREYNGKLPIEKEKLMNLPGIGEYIASAVLCFGFNLPEPILDTNTVRIIGRVYGLKITDSSRRKKIFKEIMQKLVDCVNPKQFSLSMLDFAALVCLPKNPLCFDCSLNKLCRYFQNM